MRLRCLLLFLAATAAVGCNCGDGSNGDTGDDDDDGTDTDPSCTSPPCPGDCAEDGWCFEDFHVGADYRAVWASAPDDIWIAEQLGMVRRGSDTTWVEMPIPDATSVSAMWGRSADEVWVAAGNGHVVRWDGDTWVREEILDGSDAGFQVFLHDEVTDQIFGVDQEFLYERTDAGWARRDDLPTLTRPARGVASCGGEQWFAMGELGSARDGRMRGFGIGETANVREVVALDSGQYLAAGNDLLVHDEVWGVLPFYGWVETRDRFAAAAIDDLFVSTTEEDVMHWNGSTWSLVFESPGIPGVRQIFSDTPGEVLVTIDNGATRRVVVGGGKPETLTTIPTPSSTFEVNHVFYRSSQEIYTTGGNNLYRWAVGDSDWVSVGEAPEEATNLWGTSADDVWFVDDGATIRHWTGTELVTVDTGLSIADATFTTVWGTGPSDVWFAGEKDVVQWNGSKWINHADSVVSDRASGDAAFAGQGPTDIWLVRSPNVFHHFDGAQWAYVAPSPTLVNVACDGDVLVALGSQPLGLYRGPAGAMSAESELIANYSAGITWMNGPDEVWTIGQGKGSAERIRHFDGGEWRVSWNEPGISLSAIYGLPDGHLFAAGGPYVLVREP